MNRMTPLLLAASGLVVFPLLDAAVKGTAILLIAMCGCFALRRDSAATRHFVWFVTICSLIALPVLSLLLPRWQVLPSWLPADQPASMASSALPAGANVAIPQVVAMPASSVENHPVISFLPMKGELPPSPDHASSSPIDEMTKSGAPMDRAPTVTASLSWHAWLVLIWACGFATVAMRLSVAGWLLRVSANRCVQVRDGDPLRTGMVQAMALLGVTQPVQLLLDTRRSIPTVWGLLTTRLQLPAEAVDWAEEKLQSVLRHELAHVRRRDLWVLTITQFACALHWFNPLVWFAAWRLHVERERACDDLVLASGVRASTYAGHLLDVASNLKPPAWTWACGLAMARNSSLNGRLTAVLSEKQNRRNVTTALLALSLILSCAIAVPVAMLRATDNAPTSALVAEKTDFRKPLNASAYHGMDAALLRRWRQLEDQPSSIAESRVATLRSAIGRFIEGIDDSRFSLTDEQLSALRTLQIGSLGKPQHSNSEVEDFIKAVFAIHGEPIQMAFNEAPWPGTPGNVKDLRRLAFGPAASNGLRVALVCKKENFIFGDKARLDLQLWNSGSETIVVGIGRNAPGLYPDLSLQAVGRNGREIATKSGPKSKMLTDVKFTKRWRLRPGETADVYGYLIRVGSGAPRVSEGWPEWYTTIDLPDVLSGEDIVLTGSLPNLATEALSSSAGLRSGTIEIHATAPEDVQVWTAGGAGRWPMPNGVTLEVKQECFHASDISTSVVLTWPTDASGTTYVFSSSVASDAFANREPWHIAWGKDSPTFWIMTGPLGRRASGLAPASHVRRVDVSDKSSIVTTTWYHQPDVMPPGIRAAFEKIFEPLPTTPRRPDEAEGFPRIDRAHDSRPIDELLKGVWRNKNGQLDVRLAFPQRDKDGIQWTVDYGSQKGSSVCDATFARINVPAENSIRLWMRPDPSGSVDEDDILGILHRGPDSTLLLDITESPKYPDYKSATGIVLVQVSPQETNAAQPVKDSALQDANADDKPAVETPDNSAPTVPLPPGLEKHFDWSEPVAGLRSALMIRRVDSQGIAEEERKILLVLQNTSQRPIRFCDTDIHETDEPASDTEGRSLYLLDRGEILLGIQRAVSTHTDIVLQPGDIHVIDVFQNDDPNERGLKPGDMLAQGVVKIPSRSLFAELNIVHAPDGAWTGKLTTPITRGAHAAVGPMPKDADAQALFRYCVDHARLSGDIPGGLVRRLHDMILEFIRNNSDDTFGDPYAKKMQPALAKLDRTGDWKQVDVVALFDEIAAVSSIPLQLTMESIREHTLQRGRPLPASLSNANWGASLPGGLRMAWVLEPRSDKYHLGSSLRSRVVIHNAGKVPVAFVTRSFHQPEHEARTAGGAPLQIESTRWLTRGRPEPFRLHPGESCEVSAPGIGVGQPNSDNDDWANVRPGSWILADQEQEIVFHPGEVMLTGDHNQKADSDWWLSFIEERVGRDAPLPADQREREVILFRVVSDLFGNSPSPQEAAAFYPDMSSEAVKNLATLLSKRSWLTSITGPIHSGELKFRVLAEDPDAANKARVTTNPGRYNLGDDMRFVVTRRPIGSRIVNEAHLVWYPQGKDSVPLNISLPDGYSTWAAAWLPDTTVLWVQQKGLLRKYDFERPAEINETRFGPDAVTGEPHEIRDAIKQSLDTTDAPVQQRQPPPAWLSSKPPLSKIRVLNRTGSYNIVDKRKLFVCKPRGFEQRFSVTFPVEKGEKNRGVKILPNAQDGGKWTVLLDEATTTLWWIDESDVGKMNFADPERIIVERRGRYDNFPAEFGVTDTVKDEFAKLGFNIGREETPGVETPARAKPTSREVLIAGPMSQADVQQPDR